MNKRKTKYGVYCVCGVYLITNNTNGKQYVGSSNNVAARVSQHFTTACRKNKDKNDFYRDINRLGIDGFTCEMLEECSPDNKLERERYWYVRLNPEYNLTVPTEEPFYDPLVKRAAANGRHGDNYVCKQQDARQHLMRPCHGVSELGETPRFRGVREAARWIKEQRGLTTDPYSPILNVLNGNRPTAYGYRWIEDGDVNG